MIEITLMPAGLPGIHKRFLQGVITGPINFNLKKNHTLELSGLKKASFL
jgi:hypothetical protein